MMGLRQRQKQRVMGGDLLRVMFYSPKKMFSHQMFQQLLYNSFALIFERQKVNHITLKISKPELDLSHIESKIY